MPKIVFWSPEAGFNGQTLASIAVSTMMGINEDVSSILIHGHWQSKKIESSYTDYESLRQMDVFNNSSLGITALARLVESNKLTPESVRNYAKPVLKQRLDIMYGTNVTSREQFTQLTESFPMVVDKAAETYDLVFVDSPKSVEKDYIKEVIKKADLVICTLNQEVISLSESIKLYKSEELLKDKKKIVLVCDYEERSKYNINNIKRKYEIKDEIFSLPHNVFFADACNEGKVVDFFYNNLNADRNDYNGNFISEVKRITTKILDSVKI